MAEQMIIELWDLEPSDIPELLSRITSSDDARAAFLRDVRNFLLVVRPDDGAMSDLLDTTGHLLSYQGVLDELTPREMAALVKDIDEEVSLEFFGSLALPYLVPNDVETQFLQRYLGAATLGEAHQQLDVHILNGWRDTVLGWNLRSSTFLDRLVGMPTSHKIEAGLLYRLAAKISRGDVDFGDVDLGAKAISIGGRTFIELVGKEEEIG